MKYPIALLILLALLSGCATTPQPSAADIATSEKPLVCSTDTQCKLYWQRALFYVNMNSSFKVQTINENLIQTYSPVSGDTRLGYNVSKEPLSNGSHRLWVKVWCANMFGCYPDITAEIARFKTYVTEVK